MTLEERFWRRVVKTETCWLWTAGKTTAGYGTIGETVNGKPICHLAHRLSWQINVGAIPAGAYLRHSCDTPACVNPAHLTPGTQKENMLDMSRKGRRHRKFNSEQVAEIKALKQSGMSYQKIAAKYGVAINTIFSIVKKITYPFV